MSGGAPERSGDGPGTRAAAALRIALAALILARAVAPLEPGTAWWGLDHARYLPALPGWGLLLLAALALSPRVTRPIEPALRRLGDTIARGAPGVALVAVAAAALAWALPDRLYFVGDFQGRLGAAENSITATSVFPQAMPVDLLLHYDLPRFIHTGFNLDILTAERVLGALEAAALGALAVGLARALGLEGAAALAVMAATLFGGWLGLFTGYGKSLRELVVVVAAVATFGVMVARSGRAIVALGLAVASGLTLHRSALGLLPAGAVAMTIGLRRHASLRRARFPIALGVGAPLLTLALMAGKIVAAMRATDAPHLALGSGVGPWLAAALAPDHLREVANVVLALAPLAVAGAAVAAFALPRRDGSGVVLLALALPFAALLLLVHPRQGMFRDWDVFSPAAAALAILAALPLGRALSGGASRGGLAFAAALAALVPTVQWLWLEHDLPAGFARIRAYLAGPPVYSVPDRTLTWDYLGTRLKWLDSLDASAAAYAHAAALTPSPRLLFLWAQAEAVRKDYEQSRTILVRLAGEAADWGQAWGALAFVSQQLRDTTGARAAAARALALDPDDELARQVMRALSPPAKAPR